MDLTLFSEYRCEVRIENCDLGESGQTLIVALGLLKNFCAAKQGLEVLLVAAVVFIEDLVEEAHRLLLQVLLHSGQVDPSAYSLSR